MSSLLFVAFSLSLAATMSSPPTRPSLSLSSNRPLSAFYDDVAPWLDENAWSRRLTPVYTADTPRQMALFGPREWEVGVLPSTMEEVAHSQFLSLLLLLQGQGKLPTQHGEYTLTAEAIPAYDESTGCWTWALPRYALAAPSPSVWDSMSFVNVPLNDADSLSAHGYSSPLRPSLPPPVLQCLAGFPYTLRPWVPFEEAYIFDPAYRLPGLYDQPLFGYCLWTQETPPSGDTTDLFVWKRGWRRMNESAITREEVRLWNSVHSAPDRIVCRLLPPPSLFDVTPQTFLVPIRYAIFHDGRNVSLLSIEWPNTFSFVDYPQDPAVISSPLTCSQRLIDHWDDTFDAQWLDYVSQVSGAVNASYPISGKSVHFTHKSSGDFDNHLEDVREWLEEMYTSWGISTYRLDVSNYQHIPDADVIAVIPPFGKKDSTVTRGGTIDELFQRSNDGPHSPVILFDHYDTAYAEDIFQQNVKRPSPPFSFSISLFCFDALLAEYRALGIACVCPRSR
jgi:hypothetical protein